MIKMKNNTIRKEEVHTIIESHIDFMMHNAECDMREYHINKYYHIGYKKALTDVLNIVNFAFDLKEENEVSGEKITQEEFDKMVKSHNIWLNGDDRGERLVLKKQKPSRSGPLVQRPVESRFHRFRSHRRHN